MKQEEAKGIIKRHGLEVDEMDMIWYKSDRVGDIAGALVTLADYIPSMIGSTYTRVHKSMIVLTNPDAPAVLNRMLDRLEDSAERYDEETRRKRVSDIHQYFLKRNMKIKILPPDVDIPDPPAEDTLYFR